ncbi:type VI secretion system tip protein VgrG [Janthinobacterium sp. BJB1]|uniref:type VI secretion system tip protein VgrG n=1 Tax=Janthinobacterium sp. GW458P TaxID=1981504 RepID=UPI000A328AF7|nr:type VI secretion system tip protein VgrG [Janthinobacterium sp. GW458P]MBE3024386.1 type VI secretion system tip protein VgrG [Janthinobacterium sp. GW458P]PHV15162.1 Rhs element Vgr protein [Janthinobacterium sp. BJB303]PJC98159.1 type VI secretion system tip protein VgrG [Janthinobacterium sp. BJB1]
MPTPPPSPELASSGLLKLVIRSNGTALPATVGLVSLAITKSVNKLSQARLLFDDGNMPTQEFALSNSDSFVPGASIEIEAGYGSETALVFAGVVVRHGLYIGEGNEGRLCVECRHPAFPLTLSRSNANHVDSTDSAAITTLLQGCPGLGSAAGDNYGGKAAGKAVSVTVDATTASYHGLVQYYSSDWDFVLARAEANGLLVIADDRAVTVRAPQTDATPVLSVTYGIDLMRFEAEIDARTQFSQVTGVSWDPSTQAIAEEQASAVSLNLQGNLDAATLAAVGGIKQLRLQTPVPLETAALKAWAAARQVKAALARVRGNMSFQGSALAVPGALIALAGVGKRFSGTVFVSSVEHHIADGNWRTDVEFGLSPDWSGDRQGAGEAASGLAPGASGLQIGVVTKLDEDPAGQQRIQVALPVLQNKTVGVWARLASAYGSSTVGAFFIPEIGDEVIVGYFNNDPSNPVVLASLYSSKHTPPYSLTADNFIKAIVTKGMLKVEFDDDKKVMTLLTPAGNSIVMSDEAKSIVVTDQNGNKVALDDKGILLDSPADIVLKAGGKISLTAGTNIEASASADIKLGGMNINSNASVALVAKGSASAELSASGQVTVKGAMVMIN